MFTLVVVSLAAWKRTQRLTECLPKMQTRSCFAHLEGEVSFACRDWGKSNWVSSPVSEYLSLTSLNGHLPPPSPHPLIYTPHVIKSVKSDCVCHWTHSPIIKKYTAFKASLGLTHFSVVLLTAAFIVGTNKWSLHLISSEGSTCLDRTETTCFWSRQVLLTHPW